MNVTCTSCSSSDVACTFPSINQCWSYRQATYLPGSVSARELFYYTAVWFITCGWSPLISTMKLEPPDGQDGNKWVVISCSRNSGWSWKSTLWNSCILCNSLFTNPDEMDALAQTLFCIHKQIGWCVNMWYVITACKLACAADRFTVPSIPSHIISISQEVAKHLC